MLVRAGACLRMLVVLCNNSSRSLEASYNVALCHLYGKDERPVISL